MAYNIKTVFTANADNLKNTIKSVKTEINNIKIATNSMQNTINNDFNKINKSSKIIDNGIKASTAAIALITVPIILAGRSALKMAGNYESATQTLEYTLGRAKKIVDDFIEHNSHAIGMAKSDAYKFANIYSNLLTTMTDDQEVNANMTNKLLQASAVIMSKTGRTFTDVADRIRSGLLGNTEAIEDLGVNVNVALLQTTDAFKEISNGRSWDKLSFQEQQQIRLLGILEQTSKKYGEEVANNLSTTLAQNAAVFKDIKSEASNFLAVGLKPLLETVKKIGQGILFFVKTLNTMSEEQKKSVTGFIIFIALSPIVALSFFLLIKAITTYSTFMKVASTSTKKFVGNLFKITASIGLLITGLFILSSVFGGLANVCKNVGVIIKVTIITALAGVVAAIGSVISIIAIFIPGLKSAANSVTGLSKSMYSSAQSTIKSANATSKVTKNGKLAKNSLDKLNNTTDKNSKNAKKAAKANKELQDNLQGFDVINKIQPDTAEAGSGAGDTITPNIDIGGISAGTGAFDNMGQSIDNIKNKIDAFKEKLSKIAPIIVTIGTILVASGIITALSTISGFISKIFSGIIKIVTNPLILGIGIFLIGIYNLLMLIKDPFTGINSALDAVGKTASAIIPIFLGLSLVIGVIPALITTIVIAIVGMVAMIIKHWKEFKAGWNAIWTEIGNKANEILTNIKTWFQEKIQWCKQKIEEFKVGWNAIWTEIGNKVKEIWDNIKTWFNEKIDWCKQKIETFKVGWNAIWDEIKQKFASTINTIKSWFDEKVNSIKTKADEIKNKFKDVWDGVKNTFKTCWEWILKAFTKGGQIFSGIKDGIAGVFKTVVNSLISGINRVISKPFNLINGLLNKIRNVSIAGITPFAGFIKYNAIPVPQIPHLATGGVTRGATIAEIGEGKYKEAVIPLGESNEFKNMKKEIADEVKEGRGNEVKKVEIDILAGGVKLGKALIDLIDETEDFYCLE